MSTHSPAPWPLSVSEDQVTVKIGADDMACEYRAPLYGDEDKDNDELTIADARLISAAPELLAACVLARSTIHRIAEDRYEETPKRILDAVDVLVKAIAKAEGKQ